MAIGTEDVCSEDGSGLQGSTGTNPSSNIHARIRTVYGEATL